MRIRHIFISPGHNYRGHHGRNPDSHPIIELNEAECVAGKGLAGDRYFDCQEDYKGQVTFFSWEVYEGLCKQLSVFDRKPSVLRRNIIVEGVDLLTLVGHEFTIQKVKFLGVEECSPCYWMEHAFAPGAEVALKGKGGLRAKVVTSGWLRIE